MATLAPVAAIKTITPPQAPEKGSVAEALLKQFKEEAGEEPIHTEKYLMLRQKYGLVPPQLTLGDHNLIREEAFYAGRN